MIISASRRTDIPAFYAEWFFNRLREGFVYSRNPFNANQVHRWELDPEVVDGMVFWTKNPGPMLSRLQELDDRGLRYYFQFTLTPYGRDVEPGLPDKKALLATMRQLAGLVGRERVIWRYDPIFLNEKYTLDWHQEKFAEYAGLLADSTEKAVISFLDFYPSIKKNLAKLGIVDSTEEEKIHLAQAISATACENGLKVESCAEKIDLTAWGIAAGHCIDRELIERLVGFPLDVQKDKYQRPECGCVASTDIGIFNTCQHRCKYCYANFNEAAIATGFKNCDLNSPLLSGSVDAARVKTKTAKESQRSFKIRQSELF
jgi:DNA repair photolyase